MRRDIPGLRAAYRDSLGDACVSSNYAGIAWLITEPVLHSFDLLSTRDLPRPSVDNRDNDIKACRRVIANSPSRLRGDVLGRPDVRLMTQVWLVMARKRPLPYGASGHLSPSGPSHQALFADLTFHSHITRRRG
jgi:hypothetical protein